MNDKITKIKQKMANDKFIYICVFLLVMLSTFIVLYEQINTAKSIFVEEMQALSKQSAFSMGFQAAQENKNKWADIVSINAGTPHMENSIIADKNNIILYSTSKQLQGKSLNSVIGKLIEHKTQENKEYTKTIIRHKTHQIIGVYHFHDYQDNSPYYAIAIISTKEIENNLNNKMLSSIGIYVSILSSILFILFYLIRTIIFKQIKHIYQLIDGKTININNISDTTLLKELEQKTITIANRLIQAEKKYSTLSNSSDTLIFQFNQQGNCIAYNQKFESFYPQAKTKWTDYFTTQNPELEKRWEQHNQNSPFERFEYKIKTLHENNIIWGLLHITPILENTEVQYIGVITDITQLKEAEEHIISLAYKDNLTLLYNRFGFMSNLEDMLAQQNEIKNGYLFFLDLDHFKEINDTLGHSTGDKFLTHIAQTLESVVIPYNCLIGRLGGDEFVVFFPNSTKDKATILADNIIKAISTEIALDGYTFKPSISIGIAEYPNQGNTIKDLMKNADTALYKSKEAGRGCYNFHKEAYSLDTNEKFKTLQSLSDAINNKTFEIFLQPKFGIPKREPIGAEALIRWKLNGKYISPANFLPIAEDFGIITKIDDIIIEKVCQTQKQLMTEHNIYLPIALNLSAKSLQNELLHKHIENIILEYNIPYDMIQLELTESAFISSTEKINNILHYLHNKNISIAMDDFGTGYSNLGYLKHLPIDVLKIDQSFTRDLETHKNSFLIVKSLINLAHNMGYCTVAEGIETEEQLNILAELGCNIGQGYYYSKPIPVEDYIKFVQSKTENTEDSCQA